jgi:hypothetical protein
VIACREPEGAYPAQKQQISFDQRLRAYSRRRDLSAAKDDQLDPRALTERRLECRVPEKSFLLPVIEL